MIKYDKQKSIQYPKRKLSNKKQEPALIICRTEQRKNRSKTDIFQINQPDTPRGRPKRILYKKRKKKK